MVSGCANQHVYEGLHDKHLANRRIRTDDEKEGWKVKAARRKVERGKAREESGGGTESVGEGRSKKGKKVAGRSFDDFDAERHESRASDLIGHLFGHGGGGLLNFIETVIISFFLEVSDAEHSRYLEKD